METKNTEASRNGYPPCYISDLKDRTAGEKVTVTGQYIARRDHKDRVVLTIRDITGTTFARLSKSQVCELDRVEKYSRLRIAGAVGPGRSGAQNVIPQVFTIENLGSLKIPLRDLGAEMKEYASRMFISRISNTCASVLRDQGFDQFESKVISSEWIDGGLEPLQVVYPGFGNPATLVTSPNAQVMDFLNATGVSKAFTVALSFTSTFRHPNNSAETQVIVAKATDIALTDLRALALSLCLRVLDRLGVPRTDPVTEELLDTAWPGKPLNSGGSCTLTLAQYGKNIVTGGTSWRNMLLENVIHVIGKSGIILIDGALERIGERSVSTLAIYPARFLSFIDSPLPRRQLSNLNQYKSWHA
jgi:hypothetical protein